MPGQHDKVMPESGDENEDGSTSSSEVSIEEEGEENRLTADSEDTEDSETSDEEESSESETSESEEESSSENSDSTDSLWGAFDEEGKKETQEANEASALLKFQTALDCLVKGRNRTASKILKRLLNNPIVKAFTTTEYDWEAEVDERLSKMARLFVGIHKNLAKLESKNSAQHFLQILSIAPKNAEIWTSLGFQSILHGELDFAKFAFERAEGAEATDALLSALYLSRNYHACLRLALKCLGMGVAKEKALFLKERIRSVNAHYREFCDKIFAENRRYDAVETLDEETTKKIAKRLEAVEERLLSAALEKPFEVPVPISIEFDVEQTIEDVSTCFCDLFDRVESYSSLSHQKITFSRWDNRRDLLDSMSVLHEVVDVVEIIENMIDQVVSLNGKMRDRQMSSLPASFISSDCYLRRSMRYVVDFPFFEEEVSQSACPLVPPRPDGCLSRVELAECLGFHARYVEPLNDELMKRPSQTPSPHHCQGNIDCDLLLYLLMTTLKEGEWTMFELFDSLLCLVADLSPAFGSIPSSLQEVLVQCYRRLNKLSSNLYDQKYMRLHVLMNELGEAHARDYCIRWHYEEKWTDRELFQRFILSHAKSITDENIRLSFLRCLYKTLEADEFIYTAKGWTGKNDVRAMIERLERTRRIISISQLRNSGKYAEVIDIMTRDVDFHSLEAEELFEMGGYLIEAYYRVEDYDAAANFTARMLHMLLSYKQRNYEKIASVLSSLEEADWSHVTKENIETIGYFLCQLVTEDRFRTDWNVWRKLYTVAEYLGGGISVDYIQSLDPVKKDDSMPSLGLDVLLKAHEKLGEAKVCGCDKEAMDKRRANFLLIYDSCNIMKALKFPSQTLWGVQNLLYKCGLRLQNEGVDAEKYVVKLCSIRLTEKVAPKGAFLLFFMEKLHACISDEKVVTILRQDEFSWLWSNVCEEITQCLHCMFGRYSKRRRALEEHDCCVDQCMPENYSAMVVELAMPHPLPQYDDKERLGHDVVDLLINKFPEMLKYSDERRELMENFTKWMQNAAGNEAANRLDWPSVTYESQLQSCVWYLMALHHYRLNNHKETEIYAKLFLTSGHATLRNKVTAGAWAVLAYTTVYRLFQMDDDLLYLKWRWHVVPFQISLAVDDHAGEVYFQLANTLYQIATRLLRFFLTVPSDDWRLRHADELLLSIREESLKLFQQALSYAYHGDGVICEYQWLCYFFMAKIHAKFNRHDVVKVVDGFFEAACSCELSEFFYPIKINVKKQQNIEPVELHYQIHATVWKYLRSSSSPPLETLISLLSYLRAMQYHKVVRSNLSLFSCHPEIHESLLYICLKCRRSEESGVSAVADDTTTRMEITEEIWNLCHRGFELVCDRFPHMKSYYRLAEMELSKGNIEIAYSHLMRHVFRRKKRDDSMFDSVVEITSQDIERSGSFPYHVERALRMAMSLAYKLKDVPVLLSVITSLVAVMEPLSEEFILKESQGPLLQHAVGRLYILVMETATLKQHGCDMYRAWKAISRGKTLAVMFAKNRMQRLIERIYGSVDRFVAEQIHIEEIRRKQPRKRKLTSYDLVSDLEQASYEGARVELSSQGEPSKVMRPVLNVCL